MKTRVPTTGLEIKNVLTGIYRYQFERLEDICQIENTNRSVLIREALDLWLRAYSLKHGVKEETLDEPRSTPED